MKLSLSPYSGISHLPSLSPMSPQPCSELKGAGPALCWAQSWQGSNSASVCVKKRPLSMGEVWTSHCSHQRSKQIVLPITNRTHIPISVALSPLSSFPLDLNLDREYSVTCWIAYNAMKKIYNVWHHACPLSLIFPLRY